MNEPTRKRRPASETKSETEPETESETQKEDETPKPFQTRCSVHGTMNCRKHKGMR